MKVWDYLSQNAFKVFSSPLPLSLTHLKSFTSRSRNKSAGRGEGGRENLRRRRKERDCRPIYVLRDTPPAPLFFVTLAYRRREGEGGHYAFDADILFCVTRCSTTHKE